jgi:hypothetical protein
MLNMFGPAGRNAKASESFQRQQSMRDQGYNYVSPIQGPGWWYKGGVDQVNSVPQTQAQSTAPTGNGASVIGPSSGAVGGWAAGQMGQNLAKRNLLGNMMNAFNRFTGSMGNNPQMMNQMGNNPMAPSGQINQIPEPWLRGSMGGFYGGFKDQYGVRHPGNQPGMSYML